MLRRIESSWVAIFEKTNGFLAATRPPKLPEPLGAYDEIRKHLEGQLIPIYRRFVPGMQQLMMETQRLVTLDQGTERAQQSSEIQARTDRINDEFEGAACEIYVKYFLKIAKLNDEWEAHFAAKDPGSQVLHLLRSLKPIFGQYLAGEIQAHVRDGQIALSEADLGHFLGHFGLQAVLTEVMRCVAARSITFPFKRYYIGRDIYNMFETLRDYTPVMSNESYRPQNISFKSELFPFLFEGQPLLMVSQPSDYDLADVIGDYFQEEQRMKAKRADQDKSPWEYWQDPHFSSSLVRRILERGRGLNAHAMREEFYESVKECTQFKPSLVVSMIKFLKGTRMLDFSAGWGDRLIGAMAAGVQRYVGVDPNLDLKPGHDAMRAAFGQAAPGGGAGALPSDERFQIVYSPFQTAVIPEGVTFDLIFTSPPFFDFEIYTDRDGQSAKEFPAFDAWVVGFLYVSLEKAWNVLDVNGYMAIHITDIMKTRVCEPMNLFIQMSLPGARYAGLISSSGKAERPRPIWVWQKMATTDEKRAAVAAADLERLFHSIFTKIKPDTRGKKRKHGD